MSAPSIFSSRKPARECRRHLGNQCSVTNSQWHNLALDIPFLSFPVTFQLNKLKLFLLGFSQFHLGFMPPTTETSPANPAQEGHNTQLAAVGGADRLPCLGESSKVLLCLLVDHNHRAIHRPLGIKASLDFFKILAIQLFPPPLLPLQSLCKTAQGKLQEGRSALSYVNTEHHTHAAITSQIYLLETITRADSFTMIKSSKWNGWARGWSGLSASCNTSCQRPPGRLLLIYLSPQTQIV